MTAEPTTVELAAARAANELFAEALGRPYRGICDRGDGVLRDSYGKPYFRDGNGTIRHAFERHEELTLCTSK